MKPSPNAAVLRWLDLQAPATLYVTTISQAELLAGVGALPAGKRHASTTNPHGVRAHTISSAHFTRVALKGTAVTEAEMNAAYAGAFGVPVIFISGDDAAISEVTAHLGSMESVITKKSLGFHSAESITPGAACDQIYQGALNAVSHRDQRKPYVLKTPISLEVSFKSYTAAEIVSYLRAVERVDAHSIRFVGRDMAEVMDFVVFLDYYNPEMTP